MEQDCHTLCGAVIWGLSIENIEVNIPVSLMLGCQKQVDLFGNVPFLYTAEGCAETARR